MKTSICKRVLKSYQDNKVDRYKKLKPLRKRKVAASTLTEVLIAMVIMVTVFITAISIYSKISTSGISFTKMKAAAEIQNMLNDATVTDESFEALKQSGDLNYVKTVSPYNRYDDLKWINVKAYQNGKLLFESNRIIKIKNNAD